MAKTSKPGQSAGSKQKPSDSTVPPTLVDRARARSEGRTKPGGGSAGGRVGKVGKGAAAKRQAARRTRRRTIVYSAIALAVVAGLVAYITFGERSQSPEAFQEEFNNRQASLAAARQAAGCNEIQQFPMAGQTHITPDKQPSNWNSNPPTSGDHLATPQPPGFYTEPQDERAVVHSLEHGYVAVQYKNISQDQIAQLQELQNSLNGQKFLVMPYPQLPADGVALSAWQRNQTCRTVNREVIDAFVDGYMVPRGRLSLAPEPTAQ
jgi:hypothetical protein